MIIYEVNLSVDNEIIEEYTNWLKQHISQMLLFKGFCKAELAKEILIDDNNSQHKITVRYYLESMQDLTEYLNQHAAQMREEGIKLFGKRYSAVRRVFSEIINF